MLYEFNEKLAKDSKLRRNDEKQILEEFKNYNTLSDKILCILARANALKFTTDSWIIFEAFYQMKQKFPEEFDDIYFKFGNFHYSEQIEESFQTLSMCNAFYTTSPDYKYYYMTEKTRDKIEHEIIPNMPKSFLNVLLDLVKEITCIKRE